MSDPSIPSPGSTLSFAETLGPQLCSAVLERGYETLTSVQRSVLEALGTPRDLRISSQTGSGKTLAIGFALKDALSLTEAKPTTTPRALVVVPTRELAKQVSEELSWLFRPLKCGVAAVTGGASFRDEQRALRRGPLVVVGTPGRMLDHLTRGVIDASQVEAVVLDEADQMLDLGFKDELDGIFERLPAERRTHLVSATFPRAVTALADRVQRNPLRIEGTPLGTANQDIDHVVYLIAAGERLESLINVLLHHPDEQTLVFARTRADVSEFASALQEAGFAVGALSGEMEQPARNRALAAFKRGQLRVLVATDVAARGIDIQDIARVVHLDLPTHPDAYTHRSGRTGRAGRKGTSALLVPVGSLRRAETLLARLGIKHQLQRVPGAVQIRQAQDERWLTGLSERGEQPLAERFEKLADRIIDSGQARVALAELLAGLGKSLGEPRAITPVDLERVTGRGRPQRSDRAGGGRSHGPAHWISFRVSWGAAQGADARRLVAMLCRRGQIRGSDIGAIRIQRSFSIVDVNQGVAPTFAQSTQAPDPRNPRVRVTPWSQGGDDRDAPRNRKPRPRMVEGFRN